MAEFALSVVYSCVGGAGIGSCCGVLNCGGVGGFVGYFVVVVGGVNGLLREVA